MPDPTRFYIPRRRMLVAPYFTSDDPRPAMRDVGVIESGEYGFELESNEYRAVDVSGGQCREYIADSNPTSAIGTLTVEMMSKVAANLGLALQSSVTQEASGVAPEETCATVAVNDVVETVFLPDHTTLVVTDSDASPATLVLGTHYEFVSKNGAAIRFLDLASFTQPFKLNYSKLDAEHIRPRSSLHDFWAIHFTGSNERAACSGEFERFHRVRITEEQTNSLHVGAEQKTAIAMPVSFTLDRDPARNFEYANVAMPKAA